MANMVMSGFPLLHHNRESAPFVPRKGNRARGEEELVICHLPILSWGHPVLILYPRERTSQCQHHKSQEFTGETSLPEHLHGPWEGCTLKVLFFTAYLIGYGNEIKGFHLSQAHDLCIQIAIAFVVSLRHSVHPEN